MKIIILFFSILAAVSANAQAVADTLCSTPPMGWNSWNCFHRDIDEDKIKEIADLMVSTGLRDAGYTYLNVDDCWQTGRDNSFRIVADEKKFPSGMKALADYVHARGLKFGIYSCAGTKTCAGRPGSRGYEYIDAATYAEWGVDFLKYDWCNNNGANAREVYYIMSDAIRQTGHPVVLSICEWGDNKPWEWGSDIRRECHALLHVVHVLRTAHFRIRPQVCRPQNFGDTYKQGSHRNRPGQARETGNDVRKDREIP